MTRVQDTIVSLAHKHGAYNVGASASRGFAQYRNDADALAFMNELADLVAQRYIAPIDNGTHVQWVLDRMANGHVTPLRSESHA